MTLLIFLALNLLLMVGLFPGRRLLILASGR